MLKPFEQRLVDLEDNVTKDLKLLKKYEDALRFEVDPKRQAKCEYEIQLLRDSSARYQKEADELRNQLLKRQFTDISVLDDKLNKVDSDIRLLQSGQIAILGQIDRMRQDLLAHYNISQQAVVARITQQLNHNQIVMSQILLEALQANQLSEFDIQQMWELLEKRVLALLPQQSSFSEVIKDPELDAKHKLEVSIPLIPFILDYKGELELGSGFNIRSAWQQVKAKLRKTNL